MKKQTAAALIGGLVGGATLGVLLAPKSGKETREDLKKAIDDLMKKVKEIDADDVKKYVDKSIKKIKKELDDLSMEKVAKIAKKKGKEIEKSINDLVNYVKEKGTPILEDAVENLRLKAIEVTNGVIKKLEKEEVK